MGEVLPAVLSSGTRCVLDTSPPRAAPRSR